MFVSDCHYTFQLLINLSLNLGFCVYIEHVYLCTINYLSGKLNLQYNILLAICVHARVFVVCALRYSNTGSLTYTETMSELESQK